MIDCLAEDVGWAHALLHQHAGDTDNPKSNFKNHKGNGRAETHPVAEARDNTSAVRGAYSSGGLKMFCRLKVLSRTS